MAVTGKGLATEQNGLKFGTTTVIKQSIKAHGPLFITYTKCTAFAKHSKISLRYDEHYSFKANIIKLDPVSSLHELSIRCSQIVLQNVKTALLQSSRPAVQMSMAVALRANLAQSTNQRSGFSHQFLLSLGLCSERELPCRTPGLNLSEVQASESISLVHPQSHGLECCKNKKYI